MSKTPSKDAMLDNRERILANERYFARRLAVEVIKKPELSIWMILIPIIFVFFFFRLNKVSSGRKEFVENYLITRQKALDASYEAILEHRPPDMAALCAITDVPETLRPQYENWVRILLEHYGGLLRSQGETYEELVKNHYRNRTAFNEYLKKVNDAEMRFNAALKPHVGDEVDGATSIITTIEDNSVRMRKEQARTYFA